MLLKEKFTSSIADISAMIAEISVIEDINLIANTSVITAVTTVEMYHAWYITAVIAAVTYHAWYISTVILQ